MRQMAHSIQDATIHATDHKLECRSSHGSEGAPHAICLGRTLRATNPKTITALKKDVAQP